MSTSNDPWNIGQAVGHFTNEIAGVAQVGLGVLVLAVALALIASQTAAGSALGRSGARMARRAAIGAVL